MRGPPRASLQRAQRPAPRATQKAQNHPRKRARAPLRSTLKTRAASCTSIFPSWSWSACIQASCHLLKSLSLRSFRKRVCILTVWWSTCSTLARGHWSCTRGPRATGVTAPALLPILPSLGLATRNAHATNQGCGQADAARHRLARPQQAVSAAHRRGQVAASGGSCSPWRRRCTAAAPPAPPRP